MRKFSTFSLLIFCALVSTAQSPMFCSFGNPYDEVLGYLGELDYLDEIYPARAEGLIIVFDNATTYEYRFQNGKLYHIKLSRYYESLKEARTAISGGVEYLRLLEGDFIRPSTDATYDHYVQIKDDKVVEVSLINLQGYIQVNLHSTSRLFGPRSETEDMVFQLTASSR